jgi:helix-turn-helix protein
MHQHEMPDFITYVSSLEERITAATDIAEQFGTPQEIARTKLWAAHEVTVGMDSLARAIVLHGVSEKIITQKEAAEYIGVHPHTIHRWLTGETTQTPDTPH